MFSTQNKTMYHISALVYAGATTAPAPRGRIASCTCGLIVPLA